MSGKIKNKGTTSLFRNRFLEALTRTHFAIPVVLYVVVSACLLGYAFGRSDLNFINVCWLFPMGMITFSLVEYAIHRWVFHFKPTNVQQEKIKYNIHGVHHEYPRDKDRLVMPPVLSLVLATVFYMVFRTVLGPKVLLFFPGFLFGYSAYLLIHYAVHRFRPPAGFLKVLWTHHALHHYREEDTAFGVSNPLWDYVFGTMPQKADPAHHESKKQMTDLL